MKRKPKSKTNATSGYSVDPVDRVLPEEGMHNARVVRIIEQGSQETEWGEKFKVQLSFELVDASHVFNEEKGPQNFLVHRKYNKSLHKRSDLGKDVRAIAGKNFPEKGVFEMDSILDEPCQVEIQHSEDGQYANIVRVTPPAKGSKVAKSESDLMSLYLDENFDEDVFDSLTDGMREKIEASPEYQELFPDAEPSPKRNKNSDDDEEDETPKRKKRPAKKAAAKKRPAKKRGRR